MTDTHPQAREAKMKFDVLSRFTGKVQFTAEIECGEDAAYSVKLGLAVRWALKSGADLGGADISGADISGAYLGGAWIIQGATRADGYAFLLTNLPGEGVRVKAGCRDFSIEEAERHWRDTRGYTPLGRETAVIIAGMIEQAKARGLSFDALPAQEREAA